MFKDIKVPTTDEIRTHKASPDTSGLYTVYFELSLVPPPKWKQIFENDFSHNDKLVDKKAWIDGRHIVIQCSVNEVDNVLKELRTEVTKTNQKYRNYIEQSS